MTDCDSVSFRLFSLSKLCKKHVSDARAPSVFGPISINLMDSLYQVILRQLLKYVPEN
jgi:hypothetical protein